MGYQMEATAVTFNDLEGHSQVAGLFKCNASKMCTINTLCLSYISTYFDNRLCIVVPAQGHTNSI